MSVFYPYIGFTYLMFHLFIKPEQIEFNCLFVIILIGFIFKFQN